MNWDQLTMAPSQRLLLPALPHHSPPAPRDRHRLRKNKSLRNRQNKQHKRFFLRVE
jgi:hypothetical protein